jgi:hypothetical protein
MIRYVWHGFRIEHDATRNRTATYYPDGTGPFDHGSDSLARVLARHLIGLRFYRYPNGSPSFWRAAHGIPQDAGGYAQPGWLESAREQFLAEFIESAGSLRDMPHSGRAIDMLKAANVSPIEISSTLATLVDVAKLGRTLSVDVSIAD